MSSFSAAQTTSARTLYFETMSVSTISSDSADGLHSSMLDRYLSDEVQPWSVYHPIFEKFSPTSEVAECEIEYGESAVQTLHQEFLLACKLLENRKFDQAEDHFRRILRRPNHRPIIPRNAPRDYFSHGRVDVLAVLCHF
jgi:hypothetical protein